MSKKLKTITLRTGGVAKEYVQVQERVLAFNEEYKNGRITTIPTFNNNTVYFKATITPELEKPERKFTGHSFGELGKEKALEKLETVAVGRALAFMGIGIVEGIASADEMQRFPKRNPQPNPTTGEVPICDICDQPMKLSKVGKYYCRHSENGQVRWGKDKNAPKPEPTKLSPKEQEFSDSLDSKPPEEEIRIEDIKPDEGELDFIYEKN